MTKETAIKILNQKLEIVGIKRFKNVIAFLNTFETPELALQKYMENTSTKEWDAFGNRLQNNGVYRYSPNCLERFFKDVHESLLISKN